ncbi:hypothetical protein D3H65_32275 [Paraflavitalea soli]|uniref:Phosphoribosylpyrophosphate synthetase n=1 Tax=Paraflavitalea soli TaxID=2315862 RepID=A0A3B7N2V6_9BACT|nr:hypothetical protein [Paraflavitalea soli]AXY78385.1 hypothetical protein D3H65_32275 [Paraflavitalea soli]
MSDIQSVELPYLKSLSHCLDKIKTGGYTENFKVVNNELFSVHRKQVYQPTEIKVMNTFRFERLSDPGEKVVMYIIETCDGLKGTMVEPYNRYKDPGVEAFIVAVNNLGSKLNKK